MLPLGALAHAFHSRDFSRRREASTEGRSHRRTGGHSRAGDEPRRCLGDGGGNPI